jgi:hypothetical protein
MPTPASTPSRILRLRDLVSEPHRMFRSENAARMFFARRRAELRAAGVLLSPPAGVRGVFIDEAKFLAWMGAQK